MKHARSDYNRIQDPAGLIPDDEPVFLLRGQDKAAAETIRRWAALSAANGASSDIVALALRHANEMDAWRAKKVADLPKEPPQ